MKSGTRLGGDQESCAFSLETEMRPEQNFQILNILGPDQARDFQKDNQTDDSETETYQ